MDLASTTFPGSPERNLLIIHGYSGSQDDFTRVCQPLTDVATVTTIDLPGHGASPRLEMYDYGRLAEAVETFIDAAEMRQPDIVGHSMGGRVLLELAMRNPHIPRSIVLMNTWGDRPDRGAFSKPIRRVFALPRHEIAAALAAIDRDTGERSAVVSVWGAEAIQAHWEYNADHFDENARIDLGRLVFLDDDDVLSAAQSLKIPATVIVGSRDTPLVGPAHRLAASLPNATLAIIDGAFHSPQLTHPERWRSAMREHLAVS